VCEKGLCRGVDYSECHGKKFDKTLTVHVELGKTSINFRSRSYHFSLDTMTVI
jgi:hypothetical protein